MEKRLSFFFIITGRHALPFARTCINSIQAQLGAFHYSTLYVDDASHYSNAETKQLQQLLDTVNGTLLSLETRHYQIGALSQAVPLVDNPDAIVCLLDGDDYLLPFALQTVAEAYRDTNIALTYGNVLVDFRPYQDLQGSYFYDKKSVNTPYTPEVWKNRSFRQDGFRCFHFRTFRRWLWDCIDPQGFKRPSGGFIQASGDSAYMFPFLELLAEPKHVAFIDTPLYVYRLHQGNVHHHDKKSQTDDLNLLRFGMKTYPPLDREVLNTHLKRSQCAESAVL